MHESPHGRITGARPELGQDVDPFLDVQALLAAQPVPVLVRKVGDLVVVDLRQSPVPQHEPYLRLDEPPQRGQGVAAGGDDLARLTGQVVDHVVEHRDEDRGLPVEVPVDRRSGDAGGRADIRHADLVVAALRDQFGGRAEDPLPPAGIPPPLVRAGRPGGGARHLGPVPAGRPVSPRSGSASTLRAPWPGGRAGSRTPRPPPAGRR
jgi:hypothetical protein